MKREVSANLRRLAQLVRAPFAGDAKFAVARTYALRDAINKDFDTVRALADAVLFEFGRFRHSDLALRSSLLAWQPQIRLIFLTRVALLKYRMSLAGFELPASIRAAQVTFDDSWAQKLDRMADRLEGTTSGGPEGVDHALARLEDVCRQYHSADPPQAVEDVHAFLALSRRVHDLTVAVDLEVRASAPSVKHA